jgi:hypothetical protein
LVANIEGGTKLRVFRNKVSRRIFGPNRDDVTRNWRKLYNEELNDWYPSPNIVRVIISRIMREVRHVTRMGKRRGVYRVLVEKNLTERDPLEDPGVDGRIILRWVFRKLIFFRSVLDRAGSGYGQMAVTCECGNEPLGYIKCGEFLDYLKTG